MNPGKLEPGQLISAVLAERDSLEREKQLVEQAVFTVLTVFVAGSGVAISAAATTTAAYARLALLISLPLAQLALSAMVLVLISLSLWYAMYLAVVEERIDHIAGATVLRWERRGAGDWPGSGVFHLNLRGRISGMGHASWPTLRHFTSTRQLRWPRNPLPPVINPITGGIVIIALSILTLIFAESGTATYLLFHTVRNPFWAIVACFSYDSVVLTVAGLTLYAYRSIAPWTRSIKKQFEMEEKVHFS